MWRNMANTKYLVIMDLDEVIMPLSNTSWFDLMGFVDRKDICGFQFNSAYIDPDRQGSVHRSSGNYSSLSFVTDVMRTVKTSIS